MNKYGYIWGISGMLAMQQVCEDRNFLAVLLGIISFACLILCLSQDKD